MGSVPKNQILTRRRLFAEAYIANGLNGTAAAAAAGYTGSQRTLAAYASKMLKNPEVREYIEANARLEGATPVETINGLLRIARGDMTDFVTAEGEVEPELERARAGKKLGIVQSLEVTTDSYTIDKTTHTTRKVKFKLYSQLDAWKEIAKLLGLYRAKDDEAGADGVAPTDQELLEMLQRLEVPKKKWPPGVLRHYENVTKKITSKEVRK